MISRSRSAPTAFAMSIEWTTSANKTVTCLYSATRGEGVIADPQLIAERAFRAVQCHRSRTLRLRPSDLPRLVRNALMPKDRVPNPP